jgi:transglutaminase-like putative cysteine protease
MLVGAALAGRAVASDLPFAASHDRVVLRNYVQPPFDPSAYASPLAAFRHYVLRRALGNKTLLTVQGLPTGGRLRFATMDVYDGLVWGVGQGSTTATGAFARVGPRIPATAPGEAARVRVSVRDYGDVWLPDVGSTRAITFTGPRASELRAAFRYNLATGTAVVPLPLKNGDGYVLDAIVPPRPTPKALAGATPAGQPASVLNAPPAVAQKAKAWTGATGVLYATLQRIATQLRAGSYSDGRDVGYQSLPGHGQGRLQEFLTGQQLVGNDEQYAATFALIASALGVPARVVLGATPEPDGTVKGKDVHAWVEVGLSGTDWVPIDVTPAKTRHPRPQPPQRLAVNRHPNRVPPPIPATPPTPESSVDTSKSSAKHLQHPRGPVGSVLAFVWNVATVVVPPTALLLALAGGIIGAKAARRRRRRLRGSPVERVSAGWREVVDLAVDLGASAPERRTRRATARALGSAELHPFAHAADGANFGPVDPDESVANAYWRDVDALRRALLMRLGRKRRFLAHLNLASFGGPRLLRSGEDA